MRVHYFGLFVELKKYQASLFAELDLLISFVELDFLIFASYQWEVFYKLIGLFVALL